MDLFSCELYVSYVLYRTTSGRHLQGRKLTSQSRDKRLRLHTELSEIYRFRFFFSSMFLIQEYLHMKISAEYSILVRVFLTVQMKNIKTSKFFKHSKQITLHAKCSRYPVVKEKYRGWGLGGGVGGGERGRGQSETVGFPTILM